MRYEPNLFTETDAAADMLRETAVLPIGSDDYQIEFRQIQKRRMPDLSREQWLDLFAEWREHNTAKLAAELAEVRKRMVENDCKLRELAAELRRRKETTSSRDEVFVCKCGEAIADPLDPEQMRIHQPHFIAASLEQVHEHLERWLDHARRTVEGASDPGGEAH